MKPIAINRCPRAFTLVELLVVMGIIAILGALAFPIAGSMIAQGKKAKCSANLRQIGVAMLGFAADNNNYFPLSGGTIPYNNTHTGVMGWTQQLEPYIGVNTAVFTCPDSSAVIANNSTYSYFNGAHAGYNSGNFAAVNLARIQSPSQHILSGDIAFDYFTQADADKDDFSQDPAFAGGTVTTPKTIPIHRGTSNILFADGHVQNCKAFDPSSMSTVYSAPNSTNTYLVP